MSTEATPVASEPMFRVRYDTERANVEVFSDLFVARNRKIYLVSLIGAQEAVRAVYGGLATGGGAHIASGTLPHSRYYQMEGPVRQETSRKAGDRSVHYLTYSEALVDAKSAEPVLLAWDGDLAKGLYDRLMSRFDLPMLPAWSEEILAMARAHDLIEDLEVLATRPTALKAAVLKIDEDQLHELLSEGIRLGLLPIPEGDEEAPPLPDDLGSVIDYVKTYGPVLARKVAAQFPARYDPEKGITYPTIEKMKRPLYPIQAALVQGAVATLEDEGAVIFNVEMGGGKTAMMAGTAKALLSDVLHKPGRVLVWTPTHLLAQWKEEILKVIPEAEVNEIKSFRDVLAMRQQRHTKPKRTEYWLISRDTAKLGYLYVKSARWNERREVWQCPSCYGVLTDKEGSPWAPDIFTKRLVANQHCPLCGEPLWEPYNKTHRKVPPARLIAKYLPWFFDVLIVDEMHEEKGESAQGTAFGQIASHVKYLIGGTGTLTGGYSSHLKHLLFRLDPKAMLADGMTWESMNRWISRYGAYEKRIVGKGSTADDGETELNSTSSGKKRNSPPRERPVISPVVYPKHLMKFTVNLTMDDLKDYLPEYTEEVAVVPMREEQGRAYRNLAGSLRDLANVRALGRKLLGKYLSVLLAYPDRPWGIAPIESPDGSVVVPPELSQSVLYPKEEQLLQILAHEKILHRKVYVYVQNTGVYDLLDRLASVVREAGFNAAVLRTQTVDGRRRGDWLKQQARMGVDVVLSSFELVKTGLNLLEFPTLVFTQTGYNVFSIRQAARRSWRPGQTQDCRTIFLCYEDTMQHAALKLVGTKMQAALTIEGRISDEGLRALSEGVDELGELAKALMHGMDGLAEVDKVWRSLTLEQREAIKQVARETGVSVAELVEASQLTRRRKTSEGQLAFAI